MDCLFCKIVAGEIPARKLYEDDQLVAFHDIGPQAPVHFLVIPKRHIASLTDLTEADKALAGVGQIMLMQAIQWVVTFRCGVPGRRRERCS